MTALFFFSSRRRHTRSRCDWVEAGSDLRADRQHWSPWTFDPTVKGRSPRRASTKPWRSREMRPGPTDSPPPIPERLGRTRKRDGTHAIPSAGGDARARQIFENDLGIGQIPPTFSTARLHSKSTSASSEVPPQARVVRRFIGLPVLVCFL